MADKQLTYAEYLRLKEGLPMLMQKDGPGGDGQGGGQWHKERLDLMKEDPEGDMSDQEIRDYVMQLQVNLEPEQVQHIVDMDLSRKQIDQLLKVNGTVGLSKSLTKLRKSMGYEDVPIEKGGPGSGFFGHPGQRGQEGGSTHSKGTPPPPATQMRQKRQAVPVPIQKAYDDDGNYYEEGNYYDEGNTNQVDWWDDNYASNDSGEWYKDESGDWQRYHSDEPNTVNIDQMDDNYGYAQGPSDEATDASIGQKMSPDEMEKYRRQMAEDYANQPWSPVGRALKRAGEIAFSPVDAAIWAGKKVNEYGRPFIESPDELPAKTVKKPESNRERKPQEPGKFEDPLMNVQNYKQNPDGTVTVTDWGNEQQTFKNADVARSFYADWKDPETRPKDRPADEGFLSGMGRTLKRSAQDFLNDPKAEYKNPEDLPSARQYDPILDTPQPKGMPAFNVQDDGKVITYDADGSQKIFADKTSAFNWYGPAQQKTELLKPGNTPPVTILEPRKFTPDEMRQKNLERAQRATIDDQKNQPAPMTPSGNTAGLSITGQGGEGGSTEINPQTGKPYPAQMLNAQGVPIRRFPTGDLEFESKPGSPDFEQELDYLRSESERTGRKIRWPQGFKPPNTIDPRYNTQDAGGPVFAGDMGDRKRQAKTTGGPVIMPSLPKGNRLSDEQQDAIAAKNIDRAINYDEYKARDKRKIAAEEAGAADVQRDQERKAAEHEKAMSIAERERLQRRGGGGTPRNRPVPTEAAEQNDYTTDTPGGRSPRPTGRPGSSGRTTPDARGDSQDKSKLRSYAASRGMQVAEQNGSIILTASDGKRLKFPDYNAAMEYFDRGSTRMVKKDAPTEAPSLDMVHGENDHAECQKQAEAIGAKVMPQKNGSIIVFAPDWNPPLSGKQFSDAKQAKAWLTEEYESRGGTMPIEKGFTPLDQADTPADTLPPVKKKSGATPQLTANLGLQESVAYATWRARQRPVR